jgi:hypothetical protein
MTKNLGIDIGGDEDRKCVDFKYTPGEVIGRVGKRGETRVQTSLLVEQQW